MTIYSIYYYLFIEGFARGLSGVEVVGRGVKFGEGCENVKFAVEDSVKSS